MIWSTVKQYYLGYERFHSLKGCIFNNKTDIKVKGFYLRSNYIQCVLSNFKYDGDHKARQHSHFCKFFEGIWNNYIDIQQKNMQVRFSMILCAHGYYSLNYLTLHCKVWNTNVYKYKLFRSTHEPDQLIHVKSFISVILVFIELAVSTI